MKVWKEEVGSVEDSRDRLVAAAVVKWLQKAVEEYRGPREYEAFRKYLEDLLREKLRRADLLLVEIGCLYP
jgi:hypothetical protein